MGQKITLRIGTNTLQVVTLCVLLCAANFLPVLEARKTRKSKSSFSSSSGRFSKQSTTHSPPGSLSYSGYQQKPNPVAPPYPVQNVQAGAARPPYPVQQQSHASPPYSVNPQHGAPPPYSAMNNHNSHLPFNPLPPAYQGNQGFKPGQPGSFGQPGAFGQPGHTGGFGQPGAFGQLGHTGGFSQPGGYPGHQPSFAGFQSGGTGGYHAPLPQGGFQGGGVAPAVNYAPAPSFPIAAIPVGAYRPPSSGSAIGGIAASAGTGLLAGAAGAAIYNALKPEDRVIYVNQSAPVATGNITASIAGNVTSLKPVAGNVTEGGVFGLPMNNNSTSKQATNSTGSSTPTSLAQANGTDPAVPAGKQYYPPPGQYFPATGQYVPPGEYDQATGVFTPGRYISNTSVFQKGQYDPLTQIFTPGSYDPISGQFVANPNNGTMDLGAVTTTQNAVSEATITTVYSA